MDIQRLALDPKQVQPPTRDLSSGRSLPDSLPDAKEVKVHPRGTDGTENASLYFVGTATTILLVGLIPLNRSRCWLLLWWQRMGRHSDHDWCKFRISFWMTASDIHAAKLPSCRWPCTPRTRRVCRPPNQSGGRPTWSTSDWPGLALSLSRVRISPPSLNVLLTWLQRPLWSISWSVSTPGLAHYHHTTCKRPSYFKGCTWFILECPCTRLFWADDRWY